MKRLNDRTIELAKINNNLYMDDVKFISKLRKEKQFSNSKLYEKYINEKLNKRRDVLKNKEDKKNKRIKSCEERNKAYAKERNQYIEKRTKKILAKYNLKLAEIEAKLSNENLKSLDKDKLEKKKKILNIRKEKDMLKLETYRINNTLFSSPKGYLRDKLNAFLNKFKKMYLWIKEFFRRDTKILKPVLKNGLELTLKDDATIYKVEGSNLTKENIINSYNEIKEPYIEQRDNLNKQHKIKNKNKIIDNLVYFLIFLYVIIVGILRPNFLSIGSIINIINNSMFRLPIAVGIGGVIVLTGTDLSAGRIVGLTALITASLLQKTNMMYPGLENFPIIIVLLLVMIVGALIGLLNGYFVAKFKLHPFIVTLATGLIVYALNLAYINFGGNKGAPISGLRPDFNDLIIGNIFGTGIALYSLYVAILLVVLWIIWNKTTIGKNMYAVGANPEAASVSGISVFKTTIIMFVIAGITYGVNGFITASFVGSNNAATGVNFELDAIAACVIGGISFSGGVGKIGGAIMGVVLLQLITSSFIFLGIAPNLQYVIKGGIILLATAIDMRKHIVKK